jgi:hypothetical protein
MSTESTSSRILVTVKTYPSLSSSYHELVCTAGVREDGSWVRIYPIPFRRLDYENRFKKYQWVTLDLVKNEKDERPESYRPVDWTQVKVQEQIGTEGSGWERRRRLVTNHVYTSMRQLIQESRESGVSLATFKPSSIKDFLIEEVSRTWDKDKVAQIEGQTDLFGNAENPFKVVDKVPYKFSYRFTDEEGSESTMGILDWEIGALYWGCIKDYDGDESRACEAIRKKYLDYFVSSCDVHFFLGTTALYHKWATNPFTIIGVFYPPLISQLSLDL